MPQLIRPSETKIVTKDGEVKVSLTLELNINLNADGLNVSAVPKKVVAVQEEPAEKKDDAAWVIPDFAPQARLKSFGKTE